MKPQVKAFRDAAVQACGRRNFPFRKFLNDYGLEGILLEADAAGSSPREIATRVLLECCVEQGTFDGFQVGFLAVMTYLNEQLGRLGQGEQQAFLDLANILNTTPTQQAVGAWMRAQYPSAR
jgi:hypothetical protein